MAEQILFGVDGVARNVTSPYIGVDGVARCVSNGFVGVDEIARQFYAGEVWQRYSVNSTTRYSESDGSKRTVRAGYVTSMGSYTGQTIAVSTTGYYKGGYKFDTSTGYYTLISPRYIKSSTGEAGCQGYEDFYFMISNSTGTGTSMYHFWSDDAGGDGRLKMYISTTTSHSTLQILLWAQDEDGDGVEFYYRKKSRSSNTTYSKGSYIDTISAPAGTYPNNGR